MRAKARDGQSLVDMALELTGAVEGVWALALRNGVGVTDALGSGSEIAWEWSDVEDARVRERYGQEGIEPATEVSEAALMGLMETATAKRTMAWEAIEADPVEPETTRAAAHNGAFTSAFG